MQEMFLRLLFSQMVAQKLAEDQGINSSQILTSISDENITAICDAIRRHGGLVGGRISDRTDQINAPSLIKFIISRAEEC